MHHATMDLTKLSTPREKLYEQGVKALKSGRNAKAHMRTTAVVLVLKGMDEKEVSDLFGVTERSVNNWIKKADMNGFDSLIAKKQTGAPPLLSKEILEKINCVLDDDPKKHGFKVWDGPSLSAFIKREYGIDYSVRSCQYLLHNLERSLIRPQMYPSLENSDEGARREFCKEMAEIASDKGRVLVFQDEVHFCAQTTVTRMWARKGSRPKIMSKPGKQSIAYSGFLIPDTGVLYVNKPIWFNYKTVIESIRGFIQSCPPPAGKRYIIILDNAPWHKKAARLIREEDEYSDIRDVADLIFLPPYSPDLNPIEQVWRITRKNETHNRYFSSLKILTDTLDQYFSTLSAPNDALHTLSNFPWFKMASV